LLQVGVNAPGTPNSTTFLPANISLVVILLDPVIAFIDLERHVGQRVAGSNGHVLFLNQNGWVMSRLAVCHWPSNGHVGLA
jgi:hypothetical protein